MRILVFFSVVLISANLLAQSITTQYSSKTIEAGEQWVIAFETKNLDVKEIKQPSNLGAFKFLGGPQTSRSSNVSIVNGRMTQSFSTTYTFYFTCSKLGKQTLPKFTFILANGQAVETNPVTIEVVKQGTLVRSNQPDPFDPFGGFYDPFDPFGGIAGGRAPQRAPQNQAPPGVYTDPSQINLNRDIFARIHLDKSRVYVGEQITASVKIYTAVNSTGFEAEKIPNFNGFWSQEIKLPEKLEMKRETINGKEFVSVEIKKLVLFPTKAGTLEISPLNMKTVALVPVQTKAKSQPQRQPRDLFDLMQMQMEAMLQGSFNPIEYKQIPHKFTSGSVKVEVMPLPDGAPKSFSGAVGNFKLNSYVNKNALKTDETIELQINLEGQGNLPMIEAPSVIWHDDFESFDPTLQEQYTTNPNFNGSKKWLFTAIPTMPGQYKSPAIEFSYFDLSQKKYVTLTAPETPISVTGSPSKNKEKGKAFGTDNLARKRLEKPIEIDSKGAPLSAFLFYLLCLIPILAIFLWKLIPLILNRNEDKYLSDKKIQDKLKKQLAQAKKHLVDDRKIAFYNEITKSIWYYLSQKLKIETSDLNRDNIKDKLIQRGLSDEMAMEVIYLLDSCEMGLYSEYGSQSMGETYDKTLQILTQVEKELV